MLQEERHRRIIEELERNDIVRISQLSERLGVTRQTIRRDLSELEKTGLIKKVHGGALLNKRNLEPSYSDRLSTNVEEKELIAKNAAELVEDGDAIFLDVGTTTLMMAKQLKEKKNLTVITNFLLIAMELANAPEVKVILSGGELRGEEFSLSGPISIRSVKNIYIDKAFVGVGGLSLESGFTDYHLNESEFRRMMIEHAKKTYALADHSKMDIVAIYKSADLHEIDVLITDGKTPGSIINKLKEKGMEVIVSRK
ncbi:DeoR/GlpR family DNA-binding transcription regulator [Aeribacillus pallidus]|uniref:Transcriptional regulator n=1 Tax=Aeribacillus pallidus TaxID=33936 RepID=A0A223E322_9BACI|nr:DeoR/GlpR family DNA-binding transcription regulator [Aeribacillus pallidus]ASS89636.1 transcriptional regulator [Aeribacillus pallidus]